MYVDAPLMRLDTIKRAVERTFITIGTQDPDLLNKLIVQLDDLPKKIEVSGGSKSVKVNLDQVMLACIKFWKLNIDGQRTQPSSKGIFAALQLIRRRLQVFLKHIRAREKRCRALCSSVFDEFYEKLKADSEEFEGRVPYNDFKEMVSVELKQELNDQEMTEMYIAWSDEIEYRAGYELKMLNRGKSQFERRESLSPEDINESMQHLDEEILRKIRIDSLVRVTYHCLKHNLNAFDDRRPSKGGAEIAAATPTARVSTDGAQFGRHDSVEQAAMFEGLRRRSTLVASLAAQAEKRDTGEDAGPGSGGGEEPSSGTQAGLEPQPDVQE